MSCGVGRPSGSERRRRAELAELIIDFEDPFATSSGDCGNGRSLPQHRLSDAFSVSHLFADCRWNSMLS